jgi:hypothetical protein
MDNLAALSAELNKDPDAKNAYLSDVLKISKSHVTFLTSIRECFDQKALARVRQAAQAKPPYFLSFGNARALSGLKDKLDPPGAVREALEVVIPRDLPTRHIEGLVEWMLAGNPASTFDPSKHQSKRQESAPMDEPEMDESEEVKSKAASQGQTTGQWVDSAIDRVRAWVPGHKKASVLIAVLAGLVIWYQLSPVPRPTDGQSGNAPNPKGGIQVPEELKGRVANDAGIAMAFAVNFYGVSYDTPSTQLKYLDDFTNDHYTDAFFKEFYPKEKLREIRSQKLTLFFQPSKPAKVLKVDKDSGEYLVEGVATTISEKGKTKQFISERPVGLIIDFDDRPSANGGIVKVTETSPTNP